MVTGESASGIEQRTSMRHVSRIRRGLPACGANVFRSLFASPGVYVDKPYGHTVLREPDGNRTPQAAPGARDQHSLLGKLSDR